jgi:hypothetical protein
MEILERDKAVQLTPDFIVTIETGAEIVVDD